MFSHAIALTGGIATGKSTVAHIFNKNYGFPIINADSIAHIILDREYKTISKLFGSKYIKNGRVDRKSLGGLIFSDSEKKRVLEKFLHPKIYKEILNRSKKLNEIRKIHIIEIPLFFENDNYPIKKVILVYSSKEKQISRLMGRNNFSMEEALKRIDAQMDIELKREKATYLINNNQDLNFLQEECDKVKGEILLDFAI